MKIDNMREEHQERVIQDAERKAAEQKARKKRLRQPKANRENRMVFIAVSRRRRTGQKSSRGIGADYLIEGGQTMNSTEDMVNAIEHVNADTVYILPNNKNIILAAEQAKVPVEDKQIIVVPVQDRAAGYYCADQLIPDQTPEENPETMVEMGRVKTGQITLRSSQYRNR